MQAGVIRLRDDRLPWRAVEDEVVALDLAGSRYYGTNRAGALLWGLLAEGTTEEALTRELAAAFPEAVGRAAADVAAFLADLRAHGLLEG